MLTVLIDRPDREQRARPQDVGVVDPLDLGYWLSSFFEKSIERVNCA
jgi:hypothetical protein